MWHNLSYWRNDCHRMYLQVTKIRSILVCNLNIITLLSEVSKEMYETNWYRLETCLITDQIFNTPLFQNLIGPISASQNENNEMFDSYQISKTPSNIAQPTQTSSVYPIRGMVWRVWCKYKLEHSLCSRMAAIEMPMVQTKYSDSK